MNSISFIDYIKYTFFNVRDPEIVEKVKLKEIAKRISKHKHNFIDFKTDHLNAQCAKFIYEMYKIIYPFLEPLKEDFGEKTSKRFSYYLIESKFSEEQKKLVTMFSSDYIIDQISKTSKPNVVFDNVKNTFLKFRKSIDNNNNKNEINIQFNLLRDFSQILNFDFCLFLKLFNPNFVEGSSTFSGSFIDVSDINAIDDLTKLHYAVDHITIRSELLSVLNTYKEYRGIKGVSEKNIRVFLSAIKYLKTSDFLSNTIIYLLKDFKYKYKPKFSNTDIFILYESSITKIFKSDIEDVIKGIKKSESLSIINKLFSGIEMTKLVYINKDRNGYLKSYSLLYFDFIDYLEYIKTFITEIYNKLYKEGLNELFLAVEFIHKNKSTNAFDTFYIFDDAIKHINNIDNEMNSQSENSKRLNTFLSSKNKVISNRDAIESIITELNNKANIVLINIYNSAIDITTIIKNISEDYRNNTKLEVENAIKINFLRDFDLDTSNDILRDFDLFISLLKNFIR